MSAAAAGSGTPLLAALCGPHPAHSLFGDVWPSAPFVSHGDPARLPAALRAPELGSLARLFGVYRGQVSFGNARSDSRTPALPRNQHLRILDPVVRGGLLQQLWFSPMTNGGEACA